VLLTPEEISAAKLSVDYPALSILGGDIRGGSRAYGCSPWKRRKKPGCGFVIWKSMKGHEITPEQAKQRSSRAAPGRSSSATGRARSPDDW